MIDLKDKITHLTIGVKFKKSFRIQDISGNIVDDILAHVRSPFSSARFPKILTHAYGRRLQNEETEEYFDVNTEGIILHIKVQNFQTDFDWLKSDVVSYLAEHLFRRFNLNNILRFGVIFSHKMDTGKKLRDSTSTITSSGVVEPDLISISFSKKEPVAAGLWELGKEDFKNMIYTLEESDEETIARLDFQYYYVPMREDLRDCFIEKILNSSLGYLEGGFYGWLKIYGTEEK